MTKITIELLTHEATGWKVDPDYGVVYGPNGKPFTYAHKGKYFSAKTPGGAKILRKNILLHRVVWEAVHGPIDNSRPDNVINHINANGLDNRLCNLELVTTHQNVLHARNMGRCAFGEQCHFSVLKEHEVIEIRARYANGERLDHIKLDYRADKNSIRAAALGQSWRHLPMPTTSRPWSNRKAVIASPLDGGEPVRYRGIRATAIDGFIPSAVWRCCQGKKPSHMGYRWEYDLSAN